MESISRHECGGFLGVESCDGRWAQFDLPVSGLGLRGFGSLRTLARLTHTTPRNQSMSPHSRAMSCDVRSPVLDVCSGELGKFKIAESGDQAVPNDIPSIYQTDWCDP